MSYSTEFKTVTLSSVRLQIWPLTLREEHRSKLFENRVLKRMFGHKREEVAGGWSRQHNEELCILFDQMLLR